MSEAIVIDGDLLMFEPMFGARSVTVISPGKIRGTGHAQINGKKTCILGDEKNVRIPATYTTNTHVIPGSGTVTISSLDSSQQVRHCTSGAPLIVKGQQFTATFLVEAPATSPNIEPDNTLDSSGKGRFITQQNFATVN
ncbi:hypothetical protein [Yersinia similis]|uniref:Uncharacterized protein n=1 Tax=Yersinia similis TaxID=367190 RepID=A0A0T9QUY6_9GAMM|nr:hypothetical protein [Yersinia similis]AHK18470.1 hypothetical protein BF17_03255 [Yersinia similis]CFQ67626.1 Uncharacterised protein [Yersinia similis]CNC09023.1 Uncharacterised protein [Yersinia similis]CNF47746.1 Uncharacterised protein [Yersinia similis]CNF56688.1 Uncharacterised protein [Yersinia similis]